MSSAIDIKNHLTELRLERAVTEIATLRAELSGPQVG